MHASYDCTGDAREVGKPKYLKNLQATQERNPKTAGNGIPAYNLSCKFYGGSFTQVLKLAGDNRQNKCQLKNKKPLGELGLKFGTVVP